MVVIAIPVGFNVDCTKSKLIIRYNSFFKEFEFSSVFFFFRNSNIFIFSTGINLFFVKKIISNYILDVLSKINVKMEIVGFNYRAVLAENHLSLLFFVGYTNVVQIAIPKDLSIYFLDKKNKIIKIQGTDRSRLMPFSVNIRNIKRPNVYTGHGIRFYKEQLELKEVKK